MKKKVTKKTNKNRIPVYREGMARALTEPYIRELIRNGQAAPPLGVDGGKKEREGFGVLRVHPVPPQLPKKKPEERESRGTLGTTRVNGKSILENQSEIKPERMGIPHGTVTVKNRRR